MTTIYLETELDAPLEECFNISRDIDVHQRSTEQTNERAIAGRTSGLCELGDTITWEARHFGVRQRLTVEITEFDPPYFFVDRMIKGVFKSMRHEHRFETRNGKTLMTDKFNYEVPFGFLGQVFDRILLESYMTRFLKKRNRVMKSILEKM